MSQPLQTLQQNCGAPDLIVLLPGAYMAPTDFVSAGFFRAVEQRRLQLDIIAVAVDLARIADGSAATAVREQILLPARRDYQRIWLGGISLGGLLTLIINADWPEAVDGLCLLAPYPGSRLTTNPIEHAGGLDAWQPDSHALSDPENRAYRWLKTVPAKLPAFVGYGREDRFAKGMQTIAERFPETTRHTVPGGHDWPAWQLLWDHFLDRGHFST